MKKITIAAGHNRGSNTGARGILFEDDCNKEVAGFLLDMLKNRGIEAYDITPYNKPFANISDALKAESTAVNNIKPDLHICIHHNAFDKISNGTEVLVYSRTSPAVPIAEKVLNSIVNTIGTKNRGVKFRNNLHVLRVTTCPTILVECLFIDNYEDTKKYEPYAIAKAIIEGVLGKELQIEKTPICGCSKISASVLAKYLLSKNAEPKIKYPAEKFAEIFLVEGEKEGIRGDIAFCQALHETGNFRFGNLVLPEQNNFSGLGATNESKVGKGNWFKTPEEGIRAQIQHLKAYASKDPLKEQLVDQRFNLVTRGSAPNWEDLAGKWAFPGYDKIAYKSLEDALSYGETYGQRILSIYKIILKLDDSSNFEGPSNWAKDAWQWGIDNKITDGTNPKSGVTREMIVQMFYNLVQTFKK